MGPPWSKREDGFVISEAVPDGVQLYYEPHCDFDEASFAGIDSVDAVVSPVVSQLLVNYPLVNPACPAFAASPAFAGCPTSHFVSAGKHFCLLTLPRLLQSSHAIHA